jgi:hypothetical protein
VLKEPILPYYKLLIGPEAEAVGKALKMRKCDTAEIEYGPDGIYIAAENARQIGQLAIRTAGKKGITHEVTDCRSWQSYLTKVRSGGDVAHWRRFYLPDVGPSTHFNKAAPKTDRHPQKDFQRVHGIARRALTLLEKRHGLVLP